MGLASGESKGGERAEEGAPLRVVAVGAHPDDPETGCGGTMARYAAAGHRVTSLYLTRGERGIRGKSLEEAGRIRTAEAQAACRILGVRPRFAGQIDGDTATGNRRYEEFLRIVREEDPDLLFTHWPIDRHRDHRTASMLAFDAWLKMDRQFDLYYFEVSSGNQSQTFSPTHYVDITATEALKKKATYAHASQSPERLYERHDLMNRFRGAEYRCEFAEAFVRHVQGADHEFRI
jgi:LmbE family N-acetylglucosaminyl deacetylase